MDSAPSPADHPAQSRPVPDLPPDEEPPTLLVTVFGADRPGVTAALFERITPFGAHVVDVEQIVLRGRLTLGVLVLAPADPTELRQALHHWALEWKLDVEITEGRGDNRPRRAGRSRVTLLGSPLRPAALAQVAGLIAQPGGNIDRIVRLAKYPVTALELDVSGVDPGELRAVLAPAARMAGVDIAVQHAGLARRAKHLVVMDVDSTLIQDEVIELLAGHAGCLDEVARVTEAAMRGELDFAGSLHARVALLAGLPETVFDLVRAEVRYTPGARTLVRTLKRLGYQVGIVSGGFTQVTDALAAELELDFAKANTLEVVDGRLTGRVLGEVVDRAGKAAALRDFAEQAGVPLSETVAIGDGANDLDMLAAAGLGVAFNAKPTVREQADTAVNVPFLDTILFLLGIPGEEIAEATSG
ncbi:MAG TPA: phosphoserine phosphatase SerB [Actinocrinis sp.]|nr:phosphoserine phosphatase SerB [Actinocrinis sp.]